MMIVKHDKAATGKVDARANDLDVRIVNRELGLGHEFCVDIRDAEPARITGILRVRHLLGRRTLAQRHADDPSKC